MGNYCNNDNMVYKELTKWLKKKKISLNGEMFKAVLKTCHLLREEYESSGKYSIRYTAGIVSMFYHDFTAEDGIHTDEKIIKKYVKEFFPIIIKRIDSNA